jgi:hypothetical protein
MDRLGAAGLPRPEAEEALAAEGEPGGGAVAGPALDDLQADDFAVEALGGGEVGDFEYQFEEADRGGDRWDRVGLIEVGR